MLRPYVGHNTTQFHNVRTDLDAELSQQDLADSPAGHTGRGLARAGALQDVASVGAVVLQAARQVGVPGTGPGHLAAAFASRAVGLGGHHVLPVLPVAVPDEQRDGGAEGLAGAHAGEPYDPVRLDFHTGAAAVSALAALQLRI